MVKCFKNLTKTSFTESCCDFKSIGDMLSFIGYILIFVIIEAIVVNAIRSCRWAFLSFSIMDIKPIYSIVI
jgi:hypothetical protein